MCLSRFVSILVAWSVSVPAIAAELQQGCDRRVSFEAVRCLERNVKAVNAELVAATAALVAVRNELTRTNSALARVTLDVASVRSIALSAPYSLKGSGSIFCNPGEKVLSMFCESSGPEPKNIESPDGLRSGGACFRNDGTASGGVLVCAR